MQNTELTFNDLPQVVAQLRDEVMGMRALLIKQQEDSRKHQVREYMKLGDGTIPATKPGKRYVLYQDELDKWLEANRKNAVPLTADEENDAILSSHKRKPNKSSWHD